MTPASTGSSAPLTTVIRQSWIMLIPVDGNVALLIPCWCKRRCSENVIGLVICWLLKQVEGLMSAEKKLRVCKVLKIGRKHANGGRKGWFGGLLCAEEKIFWSAQCWKRGSLLPCWKLKNGRFCTLMWVLNRECFWRPDRRRKDKGQPRLETAEAGKLWQFTEYWGKNSLLLTAGEGVWWLTDF